MNKKLFSLSVFAIALAAVFVFTAPGGAIAASDNYNNAYLGSANLIGVDEADNGIAAIDRDRDIAPPVIFQSYGLNDSWAGQQ